MKNLHTEKSNRLIIVLAVCVVVLLGATTFFVLFKSSVFSQNSVHSVVEANFSDIEIYNSNNLQMCDNQRVLPVIMYHSVLNSRKNQFIVPVWQLENDLKELTERGYTSVSASEIIAFAEGDGSLPEKPILITFDDGHYNNLHYAMPLLKKYNCKALINAVGSYSENCSNGENSNANYSYLTWQQLRDANDSGVFEIGNHSFDMHRDYPRKGVSKKKWEDDEAYKQILTDDAMKMQKALYENSGIMTFCFAYPFGAFNKTTEETLVDLGFKLILTCSEQRSLITENQPKEITRLCRFNRNPYYSSAGFFDKIESSKINRYA